MTRKSMSGSLFKPMLATLIDAPFDDAGWTRDGQMRHPAFMGLWNDKRVEEVVREKAAVAKG
jgi:hypothetical protein